jgi:type VI secretion system secreted protein Hcp
MMAMTAYLTIKGTKQGDIKGGVTDKGREGSIAVIAVSYQIETPLDPASGGATGKRQHKPITITKAIDAATPNLFQALVTNELLAAEITFWRPPPDGSGTLAPYFTISLTNAIVSGMTFTASGTQDPTELEEWELTYQKIAVTWVASGATAQDDWTAVA